MRDPNRLYKFYDEIRRIHMEHCPDWRFGQLVSNIESWIQHEKGIADIFYIEEDGMMKLLKEYFHEEVKNEI